MHFESIFVRKKNGAENNNKMFTCTSIGNKNQIDRNNIELNTQLKAMLIIFFDKILSIREMF